MGEPHAHAGHSQNGTGNAWIAARSDSRKPSSMRKTQDPHGWATCIKQPANKRANLGDVLGKLPRYLQTILFHRSARTALKIVGSDQCGHVESCSVEPAGKPW